MSLSLNIGVKTKTTIDPNILYTLFPNAGLNYDSPYITCEICNYMTFIDIPSLMSMMKSESYVQTDQFELLYPCGQCKRKSRLRFGVHDFTNSINLAIQQQKILEERLRMSSTLIQSLWRGYKVRVQFKSVLINYRLTKEKSNRAVISLQTIYRCFTAKQIVKTFKNIKYLRQIHPMILSVALKKPDVFWYTQDDELNLLYKDYRLLVNKLGGVPSMKEVEFNISRIVKYVNEIENQVVTKIQRIFRGFIGRQTYKIMLLYHMKITGIKVNSIIRIQCIVRGYLARKSIERLKYSNRFNKFNNILIKKKVSTDRNKLLEYYKKEYAINKTSNMLGISSQSSMNNTLSTNALSYYTLYANEQRKRFLDTKDNRKNFLAKYNMMKNKCEQSPAYQHYYPIDEVRKINKLAIDQYLESIKGKK